jgi:septum formation protein
VIVLASGSPRRTELLSRAGIAHRVVVPNVAERLRRDLEPGIAVAVLAERKARAVADRAKGRPVLAADTVVALDGEILGKPASRPDARAMLARLSGREHTVLTGVCLLDPGTGTAALRTVTSTVRFRRLDSEEIEAYVDSGEPLDKAGAYAIQGGAGEFVAELTGSYDNVVGLPVAEVREMLDKCGRS